MKTPDPAGMTAELRLLLIKCAVGSLWDPGSATSGKAADELNSIIAVVRMLPDAWKKIYLSSWIDPLGTHAHSCMSLPVMETEKLRINRKSLT